MTKPLDLDELAERELIEHSWSMNGSKYYVWLTPEERDAIVSRLREAERKLNDALAAAYRQGAEDMREVCAELADDLWEMGDRFRDVAIRAINP